MGHPISEQLALFLRAVALGAVLGLVYDLFRVLRTLGGKVWGGALDALFCLGAAASLFFFVMAGSGELRIFVVLGAAGGMLLFLCLVGPLLRPVWRFWLDVMLIPFRLARRLFKKCRRTAKKVFSFGRTRGIIIFRHLRGGRAGRGEDHDKDAAQKQETAAPERQARRETEARKPSDHHGSGRADGGADHPDPAYDRADSGGLRRGGRGRPAPGGTPGGQPAAPGRPGQQHRPHPH
ncbi:MAG: spore cortex biosynthesis protein YabQ [Oscillospiraceae bacterium]|nr:spore cortex biosynthesis protein YabQ [Oscillospiraceae bacterium]